MKNYISSEYLKHKNTFDKKISMVSSYTNFMSECTCSYDVSTKFV